MERGSPAAVSDGVHGDWDMVGDRPSLRQALLADGSVDRFVLDTDHRERMRRDDVDMVPSHQDNIPRKAMVVPSDLTCAASPGGQTSSTSRKVHDARGGGWWFVEEP